MAPSGLTRGWRGGFFLVLSAFAFFGVAFGTWLVLLADLQAAFSLTPAALGAALAGGLVLSLPAMSLGGRAVDRFGPGVVIAGSLALIGAALVGTALAPAYGLLLPSFLLFYAATAAFEVGVNAAGIRFEQGGGGRVMGYLHATFSGSAALSALAVGGALALGAPFRLLYLAAALLALPLGLAVMRSETFARGIPPERAVPGGAERPGRLYRTPLVLLLAAIAALAFLSEGEVGNWVTIYLRSALELSHLAGASGFVVFHAAMFAGRVLGARASRRSGRWAALRVAGAAVAAGMLLALATESAPLVLLGFLVVGLGLSVVAPTAYSLVGDAAAGREGAASAVLTAVGYSGYLLGPVLVGGLAEVAGLRLALLTVALSGVGISVLSTLGSGRARITPALLGVTASRSSPRSPAQKMFDEEPSGQPLASLLETAEPEAVSRPEFFAG